MTQSTTLKSALQQKSKRLKKNVNAERKIRDMYDSFHDSNRYYSDSNTRDFIQGSEIFDAYNEFKTNGGSYD